LNSKYENAPPGPRAVACEVLAHAAVRVSLAAAAELRRQPGPPDSPALPGNFLKHADEQTIVGLSALFHAIVVHGLRDVAFTDWAVLAAPRFLARSAMIASLLRFQAEGAWGMSPHMIPHRSLHSLASTVNLALKSNGPNLGVGGGPGGAVEVLLAAVAMLERCRLPGLWIVWTAQEPDGALDHTGRADPATVCRALAVALTPARSDGAGLRLHVEAGLAPAGGGPELYPDYFYLENLLSRAVGEPGRHITQDLGAGVRVTLDGPRRLDAKAKGVAAVRPGFAVADGYAPAGAEAKR
jgi:hypothetical protein